MRPEGEVHRGRSVREAVRGDLVNRDQELLDRLWRHRTGGASARLEEVTSPPLVAEAGDRGGRGRR